MTGSETETILLVCDCEDRSAELLERLHAAGFHVLGPAPNAATAMAIAALSPSTLGLVARPPNGRRNAAEFARDLMETWGVRSWILDPSCEINVTWAADDTRIAHIRNVIRGQVEPPESPPDQDRPIAA